MNHPKTETLDELLLRFGLTDLDWDLIIVGDGSGSSWKREAGWASISIEKATMERRTWYGAMNCGTVNFAEMMAYIQPLNWYTSKEIDRRSKTKQQVQFPKVHIFTDSKYCADVASNNSNFGNIRKNYALWNVFLSFSRAGILLHWHWIPRGSVDLNSLADQMSKEARIAISEADIAQKSDPYTLNP